MGRFGRVLSVLAVACALLAAYNVYADASGLDAVARLKACDDNQKTCRSRLLRVRRSPITHVYVFNVGGTDVQVDCARAYALLGPYTCARQPRVLLRGAGG
ncbi:MAG: hypothetical protein ABUS79_05530 [Pseudomonadota bacterium]